MAFKSVNEFNVARYGNLFILKNDQDYADVIFLYESVSDMLVADVHYVKTSDYSGYVHCTGRGCPACAQGIRTQTKIFIPLYDVNTGEIKFFDRTLKFEPVIQSAVFANYPNPSEFVFRITRNGVAGSIETTYDIRAIASNTVKSIQDIFSENGVKMPEYYENVCKDVEPGKLSAMMNDRHSTIQQEYTAVPRAAASFTPHVPVTSSTPSVDDLPEVDDTDDLSDVNF